MEVVSAPPADGLSITLTQKRGNLSGAELKDAAGKVLFTSTKGNEWMIAKQVCEYVEANP